MKDVTSGETLGQKQEETGCCGHVDDRLLLSVHLHFYHFNRGVMQRIHAEDADSVLGGL